MSQQGTLIYIEKDNITEAEFMSRNFVNKDIKNRAFINTIGAELVMRYLASEGFEVSELYNMHSMSKILEDMDIADILLPNIHIDVRVVFDRSQIFIPKSHFEYGIVPDIYVVVIPDENFKHAEMIGYFSPQQINKSDANDRYYFIDESKLSSITTLTKYIKEFTGKVERQITESDFLKGRELSVQMADHNISNEDKKELFELLLMSNSLRESVLEFDNFETLAFNTVCESKTLFNQTAKTILPEDDFVFDEQEQEAPQQQAGEQSQEEQSESSDDEFDLDNSFFDEFETTTAEDFKTINTEEEHQDDVIVFNDNPIEDVVFEDVELGDDLSETSEEDMFKLLGDDEESTIVSDSAIKLAGVAGDSLSSVLEQNIDKQQEHLNLIDSENTSVNAVDIPENIASLSFSNLKQDDVSDQYDQPTDLSSLKPVDNSHMLEEAYEHETVDLDSMESVETETFTEHTEGIVNFDSITTNSTSPTKPVENMEELLQTTEEAGIDLPDITTIALDENYDIGMREDLAHLGDFDAPVVSLQEAGEIAAAAQLAEEQKQATSVGYIADEEEEQGNSEQEQNAQSDDSADSDVEAEVDADIDSEGLDIDNIDDLGGLDSLDDEELSLDFDDESLMSTLQEETTPEVQEVEPELEVELPQENLVAEANKEVTEEQDVHTIEDVVTVDEELVEPDLNLDEIQDISEELVVMEEPALLSDIEEVQEQPKEQSVVEPVTDLVSDSVSEDITDVVPEMIEAPDAVVTSVDDVDLITEGPVAEDEFMFEDISSDKSLGEEKSMIEESVDANTDIADFLIEEDIVKSPDNDEIELNDEFITDLNQDLDKETLVDVQENLQENEAPVAQEQIPQVDEVPYSPHVAPLGLANSRVISDKNFVVGEIPIDINVDDQQVYDEHESLESIYNEGGYPGANLLNTPGITGKVNETRKGLSFIGALLVLVLVCGIGFGVAKLFKAPVDETPQPIIDDTVSSSATDTSSTSSDTLKINPDNVVKMDTPTTTTAPAPAVTKPKTATSAAKPAPQKATQAKKPVTSFLEVQRLTWEVPDYVSYNQSFKQYFQSAGKSLKLSLTSDLLLATEPTYSREIKVSITYAQDGAFKDAKILKSSGSTQIDGIVLQTVNQTLRVLKAPASVGNDESTTAILKIYF